MLSGAGSNVGKRPADLFPHGLLLIIYYFVESIQGTSLNHLLSLLVISSDDVSNSSETGDRNCNVGVAEKLNEARKNTCLKNGGNPLISAIREVTHRPTHINQDVF